MEFQTLRMKSEERIWTIEIHRPEALNALNSQVISDLSDALRTVGEMDFEHARALIITGAGEKAFVAGADIKEMADISEPEALAFSQRGQHLFLELSVLRIPVIAAVNGFALGGGLELALACDFIWASERAKFGFPEVSLGLMPGFGGTVNMAKAVGIRRAKELTFSGQIIDAQEAWRIGLVNRVVSSEALMAEVRKLALTMAEKAPHGVARSKQSIREAYVLNPEAALKVEAKHFSELFLTQDMREGTKAFMEKRKANFTGE
mgnify:CR=1 FL=1